MKAVTVKEIREELSYLTSKDLIELCLRFSRFKKENKELLTYLLFEASDEESYIQSIKEEINTQFDEINRNSYYLIKKSIRKILRTTKKYIRYSQNKKTEAELLIYFCKKLKNLSPSIKNNSGLLKLYTRQIEYIRQKVKVLHEDLQFDFGIEIDLLDAL